MFAFCLQPLAAGKNRLTRPIAYLQAERHSFGGEKAPDRCDKGVSLQRQQEKLFSALYGTAFPSSCAAFAGHLRWQDMPCTDLVLLDSGLG